MLSCHSLGLRGRCGGLSLSLSLTLPLQHRVVDQGEHCPPSPSNSQPSPTYYLESTYLESHRMADLREPLHIKAQTGPDAVAPKWLCCADAPRCVECEGSGLYVSERSAPFFNVYSIAKLTAHCRSCCVLKAILELFGISTNPRTMLTHNYQRNERGLVFCSLDTESGEPISRSTVLL